MTPEEKAVIEAAIRWQRADSRDAVEDAADALQDAIMRLQSPRWDPDYPGCAPETCGGSRLDPCLTVLRTKGAQHDDSPEPVWTPATFGDLLPGDHLRLGQQEAEVTRVSRGDWHARNREWIDQNGKVRDHQTPWEHEELRIDLTANPGFHVYPPATACEILMDPERLAIHALQQAFPSVYRVVDIPTDEV